MKVLQKKITLCFLGAGCLRTLASIVNGSYALLSNHIITLAATYLIILLFSHSSQKHNHCIKRSIVLVSFGLLLSAIVATFNIIMPQSDILLRSQILWGNPNMLAASLCMITISGLLFSSSVSSDKIHTALIVIFLTIIGAVAIVFTGSRTSLMAFVVGCVIWLLNERKLIKIPFLVVFFIMGVYIFLIFRVLFIAPINNMLHSPNILRDSNNFLGDSWLEWQKDSSLSITPNTVTGPFPNTEASRIQTPGYSNSTLILYQVTDRAKENTPYIASIYLRAESVQEVVLSTQLSKVICKVSQTWERCVTPPGYGDASFSVQLRLETIDLNKGFDMYIWGAQLEIGDIVTPLVIKYRAPNYYLLLKRFDLSNVMEEFMLTRWRLISLGWKIFLMNPLSGMGEEGFKHIPSRTPNSDKEDEQVINHAHNLIVHLLATQGLLGLASWTIVAIIVPFIMVSKEKLVFLSPLILGVCILNTTDYTYYTGGVYWVYWITVSLTTFDKKVLSLKE